MSDLIVSSCDTIMLSSLRSLAFAPILGVNYMQHKDKMQREREWRSCVRKELFSIFSHSKPFLGILVDEFIASIQFYSITILVYVCVCKCIYSMSKEWAIKWREKNLRESRALPVIHRLNVNIDTLSRRNYYQISFKLFDIKNWKP